MGGISHELTGTDRGRFWRTKGLPGADQRKRKNLLLRLIVEDGYAPPVIVTVYKTSKIEKYWEQT